MAIFKVNTEAIENTVTQFNATASDIAAQVDKLSATGSALAADWSGTAHGSFDAHLATWKSFANTVHTQLQEFSQATNAANQAYLTTEEGNTSRLN